MKKLFRIGLPIIILIALVFCVTYLGMLSPPAPTVVASTTSAAPIQVPETIAIWDMQNPGYMQEFEIGSKGHFDFWAGNTLEQPTLVTLQAKSCICANVEIANVNADDVAALAKPGTPLAAAL